MYSEEGNLNDRVSLQHMLQNGTYVFMQGVRNIPVTWKQLGEGIARSTQIVKSHIDVARGGNRDSSHQDPIVVGILATSG